MRMFMQTFTSCNSLSRTNPKLGPIFLVEIHSANPKSPNICQIGSEICFLFAKSLLKATNVTCTDIEMLLRENTFLSYPWKSSLPRAKKNFSAHIENLFHRMPGDPRPFGTFQFWTYYLILQSSLFSFDA